MAGGILSQALDQDFRRGSRLAGLEPWPKLFQNLRSTRETELAETYPVHVACAWIGNSHPVAAKHYLQVTDEHFEQAGNAAIYPVRIPVQNTHESSRTDSENRGGKNEKRPDFQGVSSRSESVQFDQVGYTGLEPVTSSMSSTLLSRS